jgi:hypothetical protein
MISEMRYPYINAYLKVTITTFTKSRSIFSYNALL